MFLRREFRHKHNRKDSSAVTVDDDENDLSSQPPPLMIRKDRSSTLETAAPVPLLKRNTSSTTGSSRRRRTTTTASSDDTTTKEMNSSTARTNGSSSSARKIQQDSVATPTRRNTGIGATSSSSSSRHHHNIPQHPQQQQSVMMFRSMTSATTTTTPSSSSPCRIRWIRIQRGIMLIVCACFGYHLYLVHTQVVQIHDLATTITRSAASSSIGGADGGAYTGAGLQQHRLLDLPLMNAKQMKKRTVRSSHSNPNNSNNSNNNNNNSKKLQHEEDDAAATATRPKPLVWKNKQQQQQEQTFLRQPNNGEVKGVNVIRHDIVSQPQLANEQQNDYHDDEEEEERIRQRNEQRQKRTRPPPFKPVVGASSVKISGIESTWRFPSYTTEQISLDLPPLLDNNNNDAEGSAATIDWPGLCREAGLNGTSRVVVGGLLTQPVGAAFALVLVKQCGVQRIVGLDTMFPNLRTFRMTKIQETFRQLQRQIPNLQVIVPSSAVGITKRDDPTAKWFDKFQPTHVVHLELTPPAGSSVEKLNLEVMGEDQERVYLRQKMWKWLDALLSKSRGLVSAKSRPIMIHVTSTADPLIPSVEFVQSIFPVTYQALFGVTCHTLQLPTTIHGPLVPSDWITASNDKRNNTAVFKTSMYIDDAVAAIMKTLANSRAINQRGVFRISESRSVPTTVQTERLAQTSHWKYVQKYPHGDRNATPSAVVQSAHAKAYVQTYGIHNTQYPCASSCGSNIIAPCRNSAFDAILGASQNATQGCYHVAYITNFSKDLDSIYEYKPSQIQVNLCRVAFISGQSPMARGLVAAKTLAANNNTSTIDVDEAALLQTWNGKIKHNGWTIVWLPNDHDKTLSDADFALPRIDPQQLFADSVVKAMYIESTDFMQGPNTILLGIIQQVNLPPIKTAFRKEVRAGTKVSRWVPATPAKGRQAVLFGGEPEVLPENALDFVRLVRGENVIPKQQILYYQLVNHWIQTNELRPGFESRQTIYPSTFPFQWIALSILVHDFSMEEARRLRCDWFDEYSYWGSNRDAEELSLAYVIGKRRIEGSLGPPLGFREPELDSFFEEEDLSWSPFMNQRFDDNSMIPEEQRRLVNENDAEVYIRIMKRKEDDEEDGEIASGQ